MVAASHRWLGIASLLLVDCAGCGPKGFGIPLPGRAKMVMTPTPPAKAPIVAPLVQEKAPSAEAAAEKKTDSSSELPPEKSPAETSPAANSPPSASSSAASEAAPPEKTSVKQTLYADSFADLQGSVKRNVDGKTKLEVPGNTRVVHMFRGMPEEGALVLQVLEDMKTLGPDEKPGVLALSWQEVPGKLQYSGFTYLGRAAAGERLLLPTVLTAKSAADLQHLRISFRYRAVNDKAVEKGDVAENAKAAEPLKLDITWRLEPMLADSYQKRLEFGKFTATDEWGTVDNCLKDGTNADGFFRALADEHPTSFKIVWAQWSPIANYHAGDTLLIDDIVIKSVPAK